MVQRLVDAHYYQHRDEPNEARVRFWLRESRTPETLIRIAVENPEITQKMIPRRPLLAETHSGSGTVLMAELEKERVAAVEADKDYWRPLRSELEALRAAKRKRNDEE